MFSSPLVPGMKKQRLGLSVFMITITAAIVTLGCRLNQADSALLCDRLTKAGFKIVEEDGEDSPNLIVVNSCAVTATAARKTRQTLAALRRKHPYAYIILTGCAAEADPDEAVDSSDYDILLTNSNKDQLEFMLERRFNISPQKGIHNQLSAGGKVFTEGAVSLFPFKTRANLKIQEGCENFCTYCIVPYVRGAERSRSKKETLEDFKQLIDAGFREVVISGVNICNYRDGKTGIVGLIEQLLAVPGDFRLRLSSTEPGPVIPELAKLIASTPRLCNFLHLPLQAGSDKILKKMGRKYTCAEYRKMVETARELVPTIHIGSDWIIGFPGETEKDFNASCDFIRSMEFSNLHVFPFSPRKGTPAAAMPGRVPVETMMARLEQAKTIKNDTIMAFARGLIGQQETVLVERQCTADGLYEGLSSNFARIRFRAKDNVTGQFCTVQVTTVSEEGIIGAKLVEPAQ